MSFEKLKTPVGILKLSIVALGIVVMGVGIHSHFESSWRKANIYRICDVPGVRMAKCPDITLEHYYVAMIIICFILSVLGLVAIFLVDMSTRTLKLVDIGYHGISALLLLIAAIVYIISAEHIHKIYGSPKWSNLRRSEKLAAGILTLFQSVLYGMTAFLLFR